MRNFDEHVPQGDPAGQQFPFCHKVQNFGERFGDPQRFLPRQDPTHPQKLLQRKPLDPFADNE